MQFELAKGIGMLLADRGFGSWSDEGVYTASQTGIYYRIVPDSPARIITLSPYGVDDSVNLSRSLIGLQVRVRGATPNPRSCDDLADAIFDVLQGVEQLHLSTGVHVSQARRTSSASLGQDSSRRWSRADNFYCDVYYPTHHRKD